MSLKGSLRVRAAHIEGHFTAIVALRGSVRARAAHIEGHVTKRAELRQEIDEGPILAREIRTKGRLIAREAEVQRELPYE